MRTQNYRRAGRAGAWVIAVALLATPLSTVAQTQIKLHNNGYSTAQDVELGRRAAAEVEQKLPVMRDAEVTAYAQRVGQRLVGAIPSQFRHPGFRYTFRVINAKEINAFALPGGPMYVNRGMIEASRTEGEMAGVMAHEIAHVALRHGTAQATKGQKLQIGAVAGAILGSIVGGNLGGVIGQGVQTGLGVYFLKYGREYETEADVLGSQIMARAGYDPRDLARMFQTIERQGGSGGPEWLSSHPNPSNRYQRIEQEAQLLRAGNGGGETGDFRRIQARLRGSPASSSPARGEVARVGRVGNPSTRYRTYSGGNLFRVGVPENWRELGSGNTVWFAPEGAYGEYQGQTIFTHGVNFGVAQVQGRNLQQATDQFINSLAQGNRNLRRLGGYQRTTIDGNQALAVSLANVNEATRQSEVINVWTMALPNGTLFYAIGVAPEGDYRNYQGAFRNVVGSLRINEQAASGY